MNAPQLLQGISADVTDAESPDTSATVRGRIPGGIVAFTVW
jgi:hypothetical protein